MSEPAYTLESLRTQIRQLRRDGFDSLPIIPELFGDDRLAIERIERILEAMTKDERTNLDLLLDEQVRQRIAASSDTQPKDVEELISQVAKVRIILRQIPRNR